MKIINLHLINLIVNLQQNHYKMIVIVLYLINKIKKLVNLNNNLYTL